MITEERLKEIERMHDGYSYEETASCPAWKVVTELVAEIRRLRTHANTTVTDRVGLRNTHEGVPIHIKLPGIGQ